MRFLFAGKTVVDLSRGSVTSPFTLQFGVRHGRDRHERTNSERAAHTLSIEVPDQPRRPLANSEADRITF